jgi:hypothetical protein
MWRGQKCGQVVLSAWSSRHWLSTWPQNSGPTELQRIQKCHQVAILSPYGFLLRTSSARLRDRTGSECLGFHLQIDLGIAVGSLLRNMPEPVPNGVDVDSPTQQMTGRVVTPMSLKTSATIDPSSLCRVIERLRGLSLKNSVRRGQGPRTLPDIVLCRLQAVKEGHEDLPTEYVNEGNSAPGLPYVAVNFPHSRASPRPS